MTLKEKYKDYAITIRAICCIQIELTNQVAAG